MPGDEISQLLTLLGGGSPLASEDVNRYGPAATRKERVPVEFYNSPRAKEYGMYEGGKIRLNQSNRNTLGEVGDTTRHELVHHILDSDKFNYDDFYKNRTPAGSLDSLFLGYDPVKQLTSHLNNTNDPKAEAPAYALMGEFGRNMTKAYVEELQRYLSDKSPKTLKRLKALQPKQNKEQNSR